MWSVDMIAQFSRNSLHFLFKFETLSVLVYLCLSSASAAEISYDTLLGGILVQGADLSNSNSSSHSIGAHVMSYKPSAKIRTRNAAQGVGR